MNSEKVEAVLNWVRVVLLAVILLVIMLMEITEMRYRVVYLIEPGKQEASRIDTIYYLTIKQ